MLNQKLITREGKEIYPSYISREEKGTIRDQYGDERGYLWCGCRDDVKLFFRISKDLRLYPEHNNYEHDRFCMFYDADNARKKSGYLMNRETGEIDVYLKFKPSMFSVPAERKPVVAEGGEGGDEMDDGADDVAPESAEPGKPKATGEKTEKDPALSLAVLVRTLNLDTFNERMANCKSILTGEYFSSALFGRLKNVRVSGMKKTLREYTLDSDGFQFFYAPYLGDSKRENGAHTSFSIVLGGRDGQKYNCFIFESTLRKAEEEFVKNYGMEPVGMNVMAAGFRYVKTKKAANTTYKVVGRLHLFLVSDFGIYVRNEKEKENV